MIPLPTRAWAGKDWPTQTRARAVAEAMAGIDNKRLASKNIAMPPLGIIPGLDV